MTGRGAAPGNSGAIDDAAFVLALRERGVRDTAVLRAMEQVPREHFAPRPFREHARRDIALPLPCGQTMTAPTRIAAMLVALSVGPGAGVLEIGTGSGYVTALLLRLGAAHVRSLERYASLARAAREALGRDLNDATVEVADGLAATEAEPECYDRILVAGLCPAIPQHLCRALRPGGRLVGAVATDAGPRLVAIGRSPDGGFARMLGGPLCLSPLTPGRARAS